MSKSAQTLVYTGSKHEVKIFSDGQMVMHTTRQSDTHVVTIVSLRGGSHTIRTLVRLSIRAAVGPCRIAIRHGKTRILKTGASMVVSMGATFTMHADAAVLEVIPDQGPGFGTGPGDDDRYP